MQLRGMGAEISDGRRTVLNSITDSRVESSACIEQCHLWGMFQIKPVVDCNGDKTPVGQHSATVDCMFVIAFPANETSPKQVNDTGMVRTRRLGLVDIHQQRQRIALQISVCLLGIDSRKTEKHNSRQKTLSHKKGRYILQNAKVRFFFVSLQFKINKQDCL